MCLRGPRRSPYERSRLDNKHRTTFFFPRIGPIKRPSPGRAVADTEAPTSPAPSVGRTLTTSSPTTAGENPVLLSHGGFGQPINTPPLSPGIKIDGGQMGKHMFFTISKKDVSARPEKESI